MATGIGEILRTTRREQGSTLADAANQTRIRESYLTALEDEEFSALGGDVYVKGFLRSYAKYLGMDPEPLVATYRRECEGATEQVPVSLAPVTPVGRERPPGIVVVVGVAVLLLAVLGIIGLTSNRQDADGELGAAVAPAPVTPATEPAAEETEAEPEPEPEPIEGVEVEVEVTGAVSWMRVEVDGEIVHEGEEGSGFSETFTGDEEVFVRLGDPAAVRLVVNGDDQGEIGDAGVPVNLTFTADAGGDSA